MNDLPTLKALCALLMCDDPSNLTPVDRGRIEKWADKESREMGFDNWSEAYHWNLDADKQSPPNGETCSPGSMLRCYWAYIEYFPWAKSAHPSYDLWICSDADDARIFRQGWAARRRALDSATTTETAVARTHREIQALDVLKRVWLKLNCGIDNEPDSAIADSAWDCICNDMGVDAAIEWADAAAPEDDEYYPT